MILKIFNKIKLLSRIKVSFELPKKKKLLLFDEIHTYALKQIINKDFNILRLRENKKIYFWIFIKQIFILDFKFSTYCKNYIKFTSPKVIITFNDARFEMYELKKDFKNIHFISIMNGLRLQHWFKIRKNLKLKNYKCDYFFALNKFYIPQYKKIISSNYHVLGHFRNNLVKINKTKFQKQFLLISQVHLDKKLYDYHLKLLNFISIYLSNSNKKLHVLLRRAKSNPAQIDEINFYKNIFKSNCVFHESSRWKKKYEILDKFENIIFTWTTMGYEAIARKKKIAVFAPNKINDFKYYFGFPGRYKKEFDFFSAKNITYKEVARVLKNVNSCSQDNWNRKHFKTIEDQLIFNENNEKLKTLVLKLIKT